MLGTSGFRAASKTWKPTAEEESQSEGLGFYGSLRKPIWKMFVPLEGCYVSSDQKCGIQRGHQIILTLLDLLVA